jgi:hypothetical protein
MTAPGNTLPVAAATWRQRFNWRPWVLLAVVLLLVGYPIFQFLQESLSGGVRESADARGAIKIVSLRAMSLFDLDPIKGTDEDIPAEFRALDGQRVALTGEMWLGSSAGQQVDFNLVYSISKCCVGPVQRIQHFVQCRVPPGKRVEAVAGLVTVKGTLHVGVQREEGSPAITSVYRLDVESVEPQ